MLRAGRNRAGGTGCSMHDFTALACACATSALGVQFPVVQNSLACEGWPPVTTSGHLLQQGFGEVLKLQKQ